MRFLLMKQLLKPMHLNSFLPSNVSAYRLASACIVLLTVLLLSAAPISALAVENPSTLVLPLKINTPTDKARLTHTIDTALEKALGASPARMKAFLPSGFAMS